MQANLKWLSFFESWSCVYRHWHINFRHCESRDCRLCASVNPLGPFYYRLKWQISLTFHILQLVKSLPVHLPEAWEKYHFRAEPPRIGHYKEYPPRGDRVDLENFANLWKIYCYAPCTLNVSIHPANHDQNQLCTSLVVTLGTRSFFSRATRSFVRLRPKAEDTSCGTGNRAWKASGTQGTLWFTTRETHLSRTQFFVLRR